MVSQPIFPGQVISINTPSGIRRTGCGIFASITFGYCQITGIPDASEFRRDHNI
jgi:hypothetical protein